MRAAWHLEVAVEVDWRPQFGGSWRARGGIGQHSYDVYRGSVDLQGYTSIVTSGVDLTKFDADAIVECTLTAKGKVNVPSEHTTSVTLSTTAVVE